MYLVSQIEKKACTFSCTYLPHVGSVRLVEECVLCTSTILVGRTKSFGFRGCSRVRDGRGCGAEAESSFASADIWLPKLRMRVAAEASTDCETIEADG
jgi:hypothetical protein